MGTFSLPSRRNTYIAILALVTLAIVPYLPFLSLPHISDDYLQIELGRKFGSMAGWSDLAADALYRCRATSILLTNWTERLFGVSSTGFQAESIAIHALNTLLIAAFGSWSIVGWRLSLAAAGFFAVHEGHQEAVVWYAAIPELLVFLFALLTLHAWIHWLQAKNRAGVAYGAALGLFLLALLSKESAVAVVPLMLGAGYWSGKPFRDVLRALSPFVAISVVYAILIFTAKQTHLHLNDGTFSPAAPVAEVLIRSSSRLLWIWGVIALGFLGFHRVAAVAGTWIVVTLLPYSFLSYMPHVPSRHVYFASAGLAFLVAGAMVKLWDGGPRRRVAAVALAGIIVVHNCAYLWIKKYPQYARRAAPTEKLLTFSEGVKGPIIVKCFPYAPELAVLALQIQAGRPAVLDPHAGHGDSVYCDSEQP
jgi:hypothetical protein